MKYNKIIANVTENGKTVYSVEATAKVTDSGVTDKFASVTGGSIFADDFDSEEFNTSVSFYCSQFEIMRAKERLSEMLTTLEEYYSNDVDVDRIKALESEADSLKEALLEAENKLPNAYESTVAKTLAFCIAGDKRVKFGTIGFDCMSESSLEELLKTAYTTKDSDIIGRAKSETEKFLTAHLDFYNDRFCKDIIVKMSLAGNGGKRVSFINLLDVSFAETLRYSGRGISGKSLSHDRIMKQIFLHYFYEVMEFAGKKTAFVDSFYIL